MLLRLEIYETKHYKDYNLDEIFVINTFLLKKNGNTPYKPKPYKTSKNENEKCNLEKLKIKRNVKEQNAIKHN